MTLTTYRHNQGTLTAIELLRVKVPPSDQLKTAQIAARMQRNATT
jgi:hypothetical protein